MASLCSGITNRRRNKGKQAESGEPPRPLSSLSLPDAGHCSHCETEFGELKYMCTSCGPLEGAHLEFADSATDGDDAVSVANTWTEGLPEVLTDGYELCSTCMETQGAAHARQRMGSHSDLRHAFLELVRVPEYNNGVSEAWKEVEHDDDVSCTICNTGPLHTSRFKCIGCENYNLCLACYRSVDDIHPIHPFISVPQKAASLSDAALRVRAPPVAGVPQHTGIACYNCSLEIVGCRYSCLVCASFDLCSNCEALPGVKSRKHLKHHVMLKIPQPLTPAMISELAQSSHPIFKFESTFTNLRTGSGGRDSVDDALNVSHYLTDLSIGAHEIPCQSCGHSIQGVRWICAQCETGKTYDLCSTCEAESHKFHNPSHCFLRITRPIEKALPPLASILPVLYDNSIFNENISYSEDPNERGLVIHPNVVCDNCLDSITGPWLKCCHCSSSFDLCADCLDLLAFSHNNDHVFVKLKRSVNMDLIRQLIGPPNHPKPLLPYSLYD